MEWGGEGINYKEAEKEREVPVMREKKANR
jgi:hypothetical protein